MTRRSLIALIAASLTPFRIPGSIPLAPEREQRLVRSVIVKPGMCSVLASELDSVSLTITGPVTVQAVGRTIYGSNYREHPVEVRVFSLDTTPRGA